MSLRLFGIILLTNFQGWADTLPASGPERMASLHSMPADAFREMSAAASTIDFAKIDQPLLDAAVFHETNKRRLQNELPALSFHPELRALAELQSRSMASRQTLSHSQPEKNKRTLADRYRFLGIQSQSFAENVARTFGIKYTGGTAVYSRKQNGRTIYSYQADGPPIPAHTYLTFAAKLLDGWMASPGHRKNILTGTFVHLGTSSVVAPVSGGMTDFYSTQEFSGSISPL